jgi:hypothetical protein
MRPKEAFLPALCVILTALPGCDNVQWGGVEMTLRSPDPPPSAEPAEVTEPGEPPPPAPVVTAPLLYFVEREGTSATLVPIAAMEADGFAPLPRPDETPDMVERFPLERWEEGTEFLLLDRGRRAGTFIADGTVDSHTETCELRPRGHGRVELRPEAQASTRFLAVRRGDLQSVGLDSLAATVPRGDWPAYPSAAELRDQAQATARFTLQRAGIPWPPSIPEFTLDQRAVTLADGSVGLAGSYAFAGGLEIGRVPVSGFGLFVLARPSEAGTWTPLWIWHQTIRQGKAFPRMLAEGGLHPGRSPEILLEVFGEDRKWFTLLGEEDGEWRLVYRDPCGEDPAGGAARPWS